MDNLLCSFFILFLLATGSCSELDKDQKECINQIVRQQKQEKIYSSAERQLVDSLNSWANMKVRRVQWVKTDEWSVDAILFNSTRDSCFISIIDIDSDSGATLDYVHYGVGKLGSDSVWNFYFSGSLPTLMIYKNESKSNPEVISTKSREKVINGGILGSGCKINDTYIASWFKQDLSRAHKRFLNDRAGAVNFYHLRFPSGAMR